MKFRILTCIGALLISATSFAEFRQFEEYDIKDEVVHMTTIKVDAGKGDDYLEGLAQTWVASNQVAKDLGQIEDFAVYVSRLPASGEFNVVLVTTMKSMGDFETTEKQFREFMKKWGEERREQNREIASKYPELRTITGEYLLGEVVFN
ncbi:MAG: hypothetical protein RJQ07_12875 [Pseudomonadales bacterium]